jgi:nucleotide-binding universal stress UspA family protein
LFLVLAFNGIFAVASAFAASRWGRDPFSWFILGALLGPIGFAVLLAIHREDRLRAQRTPATAEVREPSRQGNKVLVPFDGSAQSDLAVQYVTESLRSASTHVDLLTVMPREVEERASTRQGVLRREDLDQQKLDAACSSLRAAGLQCKVITRFGDPAEEILRLAQEEGYGSIVMGRRGRSGVTKLILGSVSERVVKESPSPVTVVG